AAFFCPHSRPPIIHTPSLHDALPISPPSSRAGAGTRDESHDPTAKYNAPRRPRSARSPALMPTRAAATRETSRPALPAPRTPARSEEHTSELQSRENLVCRLLLEKKK